MSCSACDGGLNQIATLNVPGVNRQDGIPTDVSGLIGSKSVEISGEYEGSYVIMGSHDGVRYVPLLSFNSGNGVQSFKQAINMIVRFMLVRRRARNVTAVSVLIASQATCACTA